ncbi:MAG TPA: hypothetical protein GXZ23_08045 [Clostridiales bacterium]|nr:hypothetical protein [Clostridiales bacterium]
MKICAECKFNVEYDQSVCPICGCDRFEETETEDIAEDKVVTETTEEGTSSFGTLVEEVKNPAPAPVDENELKIKKKNKQLTVIIAVLLVIIAGFVGIIGAAFYSYWRDQNPKVEKTPEYVQTAQKKKNFPMHNFGEVAGKINETEVSMDMVELCYIDQLNSMTYLNSMYESNYGEGYGMLFTGFDPDINPALQTTTNQDGDTVSFDDYFMDCAESEIERVVFLYNKGVEAEYELSDEQIEKINTAVDAAVKGTDGFTVSTYSYLTEEKGYSAKDAKVILAQYYYLIYFADNYTVFAQDELDAQVSDDEIAAYISENEEDFKVADIYILSKDTNDVEDVAEYIAGLKESVVDLESFKAVAVSDFDIPTDEIEDKCLMTSVAREVISANVDEEAAEWMFSDERKPGDCFVVDLTTFGGIYVFCISEKAYLSNEKLPSIRLIPIYDETGEQTIEDIKAKADECVANFNDGDKTEDSFVKLVSEYSSDPNLVEDGGLFEAIERNSFIKSIETWAFDESRQAGDIDVLELNANGYVVAYYVKLGRSSAENAAVESLTAEKKTALTEGWAEEYKDTFEFEKELRKSTQTALLAYLEKIMKFGEEGTTAA